MVRVEEDDEGITLVHAARRARGGARALAGGLPRPVRGDRPRRRTPGWRATSSAAGWRLVAHRGGWRTLARTPMADVADHLWSHRTQWLDVRRAAAGRPARRPVGREHPRPGRDEDGAVAIDWAHLGRGPVGCRPRLPLAGATREDVEPLVEAYVAGLPPGLASADDVRTGARVMAVYTALTRLDWALARVADGEGALAGKFRHPRSRPTPRDAAPGRPDRGAARLTPVRVRARWPRTCRTPQRAPPRQRPRVTMPAVAPRRHGPALWGRTPLARLSAQCVVSDGLGRVEGLSDGLVSFEQRCRRRRWRSASHMPGVAVVGGGLARQASSRPQPRLESSAPCSSAWPSRRCQGSRWWPYSWPRTYRLDEDRLAAGLGPPARPPKRGVESAGRAGGRRNGGLRPRRRRSPRRRRTC